MLPRPAVNVPLPGLYVFDILECQAYTLQENPVTLIDNWYPVESCCDGMSFTLSHGLGYELCSEPGHNPSVPDPGDGSTCLTTGTGAGQPTGTGTGGASGIVGFYGHSLVVIVKVGHRGLLERTRWKDGRCLIGRRRIAVVCA